MKAVAFGGGHGLKASLHALLLSDAQVSAVVVVSDDGGSSGKIRERFPVLPPGDLRMAFETLTQDETWSKLLGHRYGGNNELSNHAVGNLILLAFLENCKDTQHALDDFAKLVASRGRVFPMSTEPVQLVAQVQEEQKIFEVQGQVAIASSKGAIEDIQLIPKHPKVSNDALAAIAQAELLVFGPGSWWTSVIPHFKVKEIKQAIKDSQAKKLIINNLIPEKGETENYQLQTFLSVLKNVAQDIKFDFVINEITKIQANSELDHSVKQLGAENILADVALYSSIEQKRGLTHDPKKLANLFIELRRGGKI